MSTRLGEGASRAPRPDVHGLHPNRSRGRFAARSARLRASSPTCRSRRARAERSQTRRGVWRRGCNRAPTAGSVAGSTASAARAFALRASASSLPGDHDVACRLRDVGGGAHRHRDVGAGEHRSVVHAVTDDDDTRAILAKRREPRELFRRCLARNPGLDAQRSQPPMRPSPSRLHLRSRPRGRRERGRRPRRALPAAVARRREMPRWPHRRRRGSRRRRGRKRCASRGQRVICPAEAIAPSSNDARRFRSPRYFRARRPGTAPPALRPRRQRQASGDCLARAQRRVQVQRPDRCLAASQCGSAQCWARSASPSCQRSRAWPTARSSSASGRTTRTPRPASTASVRVTAAGAASANAQGQATTRTATVAENARSGSAIAQPMAVQAASTSTRAMKPAAARSPARASARLRGRSACRQRNDARNDRVCADSRHAHGRRIAHNDATGA